MFGNKSCGAKNHFITTGKIEVPLYLSKLLSEWSKAAIRTQPSNLLLWSSIYFSMKASGKQPPVKEYLDYPDLKLGPGGLTPNTLKALAKTLSNEYETYDKIEAMWNILSLKKKIFMEIIKIGNFKNDIKSNEFIGIAASYLNNCLKGTMLLLCDTLSTDHTSGILLEIFVEIYQYLARLDCVDVVLSSNENSLVELEVENYEENSIHDKSQCFSSLSSQTCSLDTEFSCHPEVEELSTNLLHTRSAEGIMVWQDVNMDHGPESLTEILRTPMINTPMITTVCDDQEYELLIKKLKDNPYDQEILSQLSAESVICNDPQSEISLNSMSDTTQKPEHLYFEELGNEEIIGNPSSLVLTESNYEKNDFGVQNEDKYNVNDYTEINSEVLDEMSMIKYEDNINEIDSEMNEENKNNINSLTNIEVNKDFIVMMALVTDANDPLSNIETMDESLGDNESLKSEFSILEKTDLNLNAADDDNNKTKVIKQTFDETAYMTNDKESSGSEISSGSDGFRHSDTDQQSNRSVALEKSSIHSESDNSAIYSSKDDLVSLTDNNKFDEDQLTLHELSESAQFEFIDTPEEPFDQNKETFEECEEHLHSSDKSIDIPIEDKKVDSKIKHPEKRTRVMLGIGPALSEKQIKYVIDWVTKCASKQNNYVQDHNLIHFQCPPLDYESESANKKSDKNACF